MFLNWDSIVLDWAHDFLVNVFGQVFVGKVFKVNDSKYATRADHIVSYTVCNFHSVIIWRAILQFDLAIVFSLHDI